MEDLPTQNEIRTLGKFDYQFIDKIELIQWESKENFIYEEIRPVSD